MIYLATYDNAPHVTVVVRAKNASQAATLARGVLGTEYTDNLGMITIEHVGAEGDNQVIVECWS